jgi:hypothetical protein
MKLDIRKLIKESFEIAESMLEEFNSLMSEDMLDEERITNKQAAEHVEKRENFVGSHTYGEDLGGLGAMYVAYSYGEQHPLYVWTDDTWYYNYDDYINPDGSVNKWTKKHLEDLRPNAKTQGRPTSYLQKLITNFKKTHGLGDNSHTDLEPGEK